MEAAKTEQQGANVAQAEPRTEQQGHAAVPALLDFSGLHSEQLRALLDSDSALAQCLRALEERGQRLSHCPHCHGDRLYRHGVTRGLQRYRCRHCGRTCNALTNTPLAHLRLRGKWLPFLECALRSMTVRGSAATVGIHRNTSFRWRHRFQAKPGEEPMSDPPDAPPPK